MVTLKEITEFLDRELKSEIADSSLNGLQVEGKDEIEKVGFSVDGSLEAISWARDNGVDMMVVHHGILWKKPEVITGYLYHRLKILIESQISLYAVHLPLDAHPLFGNNITLARLISDKTRPFGRDLIGYIAEKECVIEDVVNLLESKLKTSCRAFLFGPERTKKIAVATGGGADLLSEAIKESADTFITGEPRLSAYHLAKENRMNLIFAGHYATEILGIKALLKEVETSFSVECIFFDSHVEI